MSRGTDFPAEFHRLPMKLRAMQWTGINELAIQTELTGTQSFRAIPPCEGEDCQCGRPGWATAEVLSSFSHDWQVIGEGWWVCMNEDGKLFPLDQATLDANYVTG